MHFFSPHSVQIGDAIGQAPQSNIYQGQASGQSACGVPITFLHLPCPLQYIYMHMYSRKFPFRVRATAVQHSVFVPFPFLLHSVFRFTCLPHQGRRKRSGWSGFGRTNIEGESGRVHIAAACRRGCKIDRHATLY